MRTTTKKDKKFQFVDTELRFGSSETNAWADSNLSKSVSRASV